MPAMTSKYFARSVIYMCMHNAKGAMGLIINQRAGTISFPKLLRELGVLSGDDEDAVPVDILSMVQWKRVAASCCTAQTTPVASRQWRSRAAFA